MKPIKQPSATATLDVVVGIDGGGTRTTAVAMTADGAVVARGEAGSSNSKAVGLAAALAALGQALGGVAAGLPAGARVVGLHAALAGAGRSEDADRLRAALHGVCRAAPLIGRFGALEMGAIGVGNDAMAALAAADTTSGVVVIAGTGSLVWGCNASGATARAGGWGYLLGDEGSGFDLGQRALRAVLAAHDAAGPATALTGAILAALAIPAPPALVDRVYGDPSPRAVIAGLAPIALAQAAAGDPVAAAIGQEGAAALARQAGLVARRLGLVGAPYPVVCSGGLFADRWYRAAFGETLDASAGATVRIPTRPATEGAALLAWRAHALALRHRRGA